MQASRKNLQVFAVDKNNLFGTHELMFFKYLVNGRIKNKGDCKHYIWDDNGNLRCKGLGETKEAQNLQNCHSPGLL